MKIQTIYIPYDSGHRDLRMGRGPEQFFDHGLDRILAECGHQVSSTHIEAQAAFMTEIGTAIELNRALAGQVRSANREDAFPIVLAGNCNACLGVLAGSQKEGLGMLWFDAHGDFNTPETTRSGFLDGMGMAMATGRCWRALLDTIPGFTPIPEADVVHIGGRDLDEEEEKLLRACQIQVVRAGVGAGDIRTAVDATLDNLVGRVTSIYIHVDMDVLDTGEARPNHLAAPGGLPVEHVEEIIATTREKFKICAGAITAFDPDFDKGERVYQAGVRIIKAMVVQN